MKGPIFGKSWHYSIQKGLKLDILVNLFQIQQYKYHLIINTINNNRTFNKNNIQLDL